MGVHSRPFLRPDLEFIAFDPVRRKRTCLLDLVNVLLGIIPKSMDLTIHLSTMAQATPLGQVKLGQLPGWILSRSKNPIDWGRCVARGWWRWRFNYLTPKYATLAGPLQFIAATCVFFYAINYDKTYSKHRQRKYQW